MNNNGFVNPWQTISSSFKNPTWVKVQKSLKSGLILGEFLFIIATWG
jgi:hypothetical protein